MVKLFNPSITDYMRLDYKPNQTLKIVSRAIEQLPPHAIQITQTMRCTRLAMAIIPPNTSYPIGINSVYIP